MNAEASTINARITASENGALGPSDRVQIDAQTHGTKAQVPSISKLRRYTDSPRDSLNPFRSKISAGDHLHDRARPCARASARVPESSILEATPAGDHFELPAR